MKRDPHFDTVRQKGWLAALPVPVKEALLARANLRRVAAGETIYSLGAPPGGLYGLAEGSLSVVAALGPYLPRLVHIARPGWWVGEASMVSRTQTRVEIAASTQSAVLVIGENAVGDIARDTPEVWRWLNLLTVAHMDNALQLAGCVLAKSPAERVAGTLLRLSGRDETGPVRIPVTQGELAEMAGLSRNPAGKVLQRLEGCGVIARYRGSIEILDRPVLERTIRT